MSHLAEFNMGMKLNHCDSGSTRHAEFCFSQKKHTTRYRAAYVAALFSHINFRYHSISVPHAGLLSESESTPVLNWALYSSLSRLSSPFFLSSRLPHKFRNPSECRARALPLPYFHPVGKSRGVNPLPYMTQAGISRVSPNLSGGRAHSSEIRRLKRRFFTASGPPAQPSAAGRMRSGRSAPRRPGESPASSPGRSSRQWLGR